MSETTITVYQVDEADDGSARLYVNTDARFENQQEVNQIAEMIEALGERCQDCTIAKYLHDWNYNQGHNFRKAKP